MANTDTPSGLRPHGHIYGMNPYTVAATDAVAIKEGSPVKVLNTGYVALADPGDEVLVGVAANAIAALTGGKLWVYDHPLQQFVIQDDASAVLDISAQNAQADFAAESSTTNQSNVELVASVISTADGNLRILHPANTLYPDGTVNAWGINCDLVVMINEHVYKATAGV